MPSTNHRGKQINRTERPKKIVGRCPTCGVALTEPRCLGCRIDQAETVRTLLRSIPRGQIISMIENARKEETPA